MSKENTDLIEIEIEDAGENDESLPSEEQGWIHVGYCFFSREWEAFKKEKEKNLREIPKKKTTLSAQAINYIHC